MDWIKDGLHFSCNQCGVCCTGTPGYIWVTPEEMKDLAQTLHTDFDEFTRQNVKKVGEHYSLIEKPNGDCILWEKDQGCTAYQARPQQCRTYPFWPEVVATQQTWEDEALECQGIQQGLAHHGQFHSLSEIHKTVEVAKQHDPQH